jgi:uncharacterized protein with NAD-binding domain and iron-sulfur cluster
VAILGGGMAGLSAAWRLSEPGWEERFGAITVYQRGWRLGGKGASSRGVHGRIEEHGLHIWLGYYENAFALLRECYAELDRATTDPAAPLRTWDQALVPADDLGLADRHDGSWQLWLGTFARYDGTPGDPETTGREMTVVEFLRRAFGLLVDFAGSMPGRSATAVQVGALAVLVELGELGRTALAGQPPRDSIDVGPLDDALAAVRSALADASTDAESRRCWLLVSLMAAVIRGLVADGLLVDPRGFAAINDEDFGDWIVRHGADPAVLDFALVRGLYDLVFGYRDGDPDQPAFAAGLAVFLTGKTLFEYRGSIFWKMTAGMGDVVFAPLYEVLRRRGVEFEFFHRVDDLHLDPAHCAIEAVTMGRQAALAEGVDRYEPLTRVRGLPVFPSAPLAEQLHPGGLRDDVDVDSHLGPRHDVETRILRRGEDFDHLVLAVPVAMVGLVASELVDDRPEWRDMVTQLGTVATQAFQIWLRPDEPSLGWERAGVTISGHVSPFETWASMPQTLWAEDWPEDDRPGTVAYFCNALDAEWPTDGADERYRTRHEMRVRNHAVTFLNGPVARLLPETVGAEGFAWPMLCGANGSRDASAFDSQFWTANVDPSDRYVQSLPGTDRYRLRPDESGYDNLVLAGDWTDSGLNAGCIEAAVLSGFQAANALLGRSRRHRLRGYYLG